jgi:copper chaperone CopZ
MREDDMASIAIDVPLMYADHHVVAVRRILLEAPGVKGVVASSAFHVVQIDYDPDQASEDDLKQILDENGYLGELQVPVESGKPVDQSGGESYFRHSAAYACAGATLSFGQEVTPSGRPLWPCPGMKPAPKMDE